MSPVNKKYISNPNPSLHDKYLEQFSSFKERSYGMHNMEGKESPHDENVKSWTLHK